jgi:hypothetical protein
LSLDTEDWPVKRSKSPQKAKVKRKLVTSSVYDNCPCLENCLNQ